MTGGEWPENSEESTNGKEILRVIGWTAVLLGTLAGIGLLWERLSL